MYFFGLCYSNYQIFLLSPSLPPSLPRSLWWTRVLFAALCDSVCVSDCGKISWLSVRVPRSLYRLFPWGLPGSQGLSPTIALRSFSSQQPLSAVAVVAEFPCPAFWVLNHLSKLLCVISHQVRQRSLSFQMGEIFQAFQHSDKEAWGKALAANDGAEIKSWICNTVGRMVQTVMGLLWLLLQNMSL